MRSTQRSAAWIILGLAIGASITAAQAAPLDCSSGAAPTQTQAVYRAARKFFDEVTVPHTQDQRRALVEKAFKPLVESKELKDEFTKRASLLKRDREDPEIRQAEFSQALVGRIREASKGALASLAASLPKAVPTNHLEGREVDFSEGGWPFQPVVKVRDRYKPQLIDGNPVLFERVLTYYLAKGEFEESMTTTLGTGSVVYLYGYNVSQSEDRFVEVVKNAVSDYCDDVSDGSGD